MNEKNYKNDTLVIIIIRRYYINMQIFSFMKSWQLRKNKSTLKFRSCDYIKHNTLNVKFLILSSTFITISIYIQ